MIVVGSIRSCAIVVVSVYVCVFHIKALVCGEGTRYTAIFDYFPIAKLTLDDLRKIYFEMKEKVFKQQSKVLTVAYDTEALEKLLQDSLGTEARMSDVDKPK